MSSVQGVGVGGVPLYTEVYSFQGVEIEGFNCIQGFHSYHGVRIEVKVAMNGDESHLDSRFWDSISFPDSVDLV